MPEESQDVYQLVLIYPVHAQHLQASFHTILAAVQLAARLCSLAQPDQILLADVIRVHLAERPIRG